MEIKNPYNNSNIWYYSTDQVHLPVILENGLKCFQLNHSVNFRTPWLHLSQSPDPELVNIQVDITDITAVDWSYVENSRQEKLLRVYQDISADRLSKV